MRLIRVCLENYQGIRSLELELDPTSVLFGENGCGKSSLFRALELVLSPASLPVEEFFRAQDHHLDPATGESTGRILIELEFQADSEPFDAVGSDGRFRFQAWSEPTGFRFVSDRLESSDPKLLEDLRRLCPLIRLRGGLLRAPRLGQDRPVARAVEAVFSRLLETDQVPPDLVRHALERLSERRGLLEGRPVPFSVRQRVEAPMAHPADLGQLLQGSGSRSMALLLLSAFLLEASGGLQPGAQPLLLFEEPEAGLHPVGIATISSLLETFPSAKLISSTSPDFLATVPLGSLRRLVRRPDGRVRVFSPRPEDFEPSELRRAGYHVRVRRGSALLMRCWLLVEGESEFWLCNEAARTLGFDLSQEAVACLEFAQVGLVPMVNLARSLGIRWSLLADGDKAGQGYTREARRLPGGAVYQLAENDLEHCLWSHGYEPLYREAAGSSGLKPSAVIQAAVKRRTKPHMALLVGEEMRRRGPDGVPPVLERMLQESVRAARREDPFSG